MTTHTFNMKPVKVELCRMVPTKDGRGKTSEKYADRHATATVTIDLDKLQYLVNKAAYSKGGRSCIAHGAVVCKRTSYNDTPVKDPSP